MKSPQMHRSFIRASMWNVGSWTTYMYIRKQLRKVQNQPRWK